MCMVLKYFVYSRSVVLATYNSGHSCLMGLFSSLSYRAEIYHVYFCISVSKFQVILHYFMQTSLLISVEFSL